MDELFNVDVYLNSSNRNSFCVLECDAPASLETVSKISLEFFNGIVVDSEKYPRCFRWNISGVGKCVVYLYLGREDIDISNGVYNADVFLYDEYNHQGAWGGKIRLFIYNRV